MKQLLTSLSLLTLCVSAADAANHKESADICIYGGTSGGAVAAA